MAKPRVIGTTRKAIRAAEAELGRDLPESFSAWLLANNGKAIGALVVFPVQDPRDPRKTWDSIVRRFNEDWRESKENCPDTLVAYHDLLPFAEFGTGDYYCFDYRTLGSAGEPIVVLWSHETGRISPVADSFGAFVAEREVHER